MGFATAKLALEHRANVVIAGRSQEKLANKEKLPVGRIGTADEVAQAVLMLMTNGFITGEVLHFDGGGGLI